MMFSIDQVIERFEKIETDFGVELTPEVICAALSFLQDFKKVSDIVMDYCEHDEYAEMSASFLKILDIFKSGTRPISQQKNYCSFCANHCKDDTLYESSSWDGGIGFDYIRDIKYCPICGRTLSDDD